VQRGGDRDMHPRISSTRNPFRDSRLSGLDLRMGTEIYEPFDV